MSLGKIPLPNEWMGKPLKGSIEKVLAEADTKEEVEEERNLTPDASNLGAKDKYIILPSRTHEDYEYPDLLVPFDRTHLNRNWNESWSALRNENAFMLTIRQYVDFLNLLKSGNAFDGNGRKISETKLDDLFGVITEVRSPWRSEWLDAKFENKTVGKTMGVINRNQLHITYHVLDSNGSLREVLEPLQNYLIGDKAHGVDMKHWLQNATYQGLPSSDNQDGQLYYWHPRNNKVARFVAGSGGAGLYCVRYPTDRVASLGVRAAREKK